MARLAALLLALIAAVAACTHAVQPVPLRVAPALTSAGVDAEGEVERCYRDALHAHRRVCPHCPVPTLERFVSGHVAQVDFDPRRRPIVRYDAERMRDIWRRHGRDAVVGIFAHELGHIYTDHAGTATRCPWLASTSAMLAACRRDELSADAYGGCLLVVLGRDAAPFQGWLASTGEGRLHPAGDVRARSAGYGAERCVGLW